MKICQNRFNFEQKDYFHETNMKSVKIIEKILEKMYFLLGLEKNFNIW